MAEKYVDMVRVFIGAFPDGPLPENLDEGHSFEFGVGGSIDREALMAAIEADLRPKPFHVADRYSHFSWGADGAALEIVIGVASGAAGGAVGALIERLLHEAGGQKLKADLDGEQAAERARDALARFTDARPSSIQIEGVESVRSGFRIELTKGKLRFEATVGPGGLTKLRRKKK